MEVAMTDISKAIHSAVAEWMKKHKPASTVAEAKNYYSTSEILNMCNDIFFDESLSEEQLFKFLSESGYEMIDMDGLQRWIIK